MAARLSQRVQITILAAVAVAAAVLYVALRPGTGMSAPEDAAGAAATRSGQPVAFKPTKEESAGLVISPIEPKMFRPETIAEGTIATDDDLTTPVFSPYSGHVVRVIAKLGDAVAKGAPLFELAATELVQGVNTLITSAAALKTARSQLAQAETNEKRAHDLYLAKGGTLKDWQQSRTDLVTAQNTLNSADVALAAARNQLQILGKDEAEIARLEAQPTHELNPTAAVTAPIAGIVTQRQVGLGQYIQSVSTGATTPVYTIGNLSTVWLLANVREADAGQMQTRLPVEVTVPAYPGRIFEAAVSWVAPGIDASTHRLQVRADVANPAGLLKPNMFVSFRIVTGKARSSPAVPQSAIVYEGDTARVWISGPDGTLSSRPIRTGQTSNGMVEVTSGLKAGDQVVTGGALFIDRAASGD